MKQFLILLILALFVSACEINPPRSSSSKLDDRGVHIVPFNTSSSNKKVALVVGNRLYRYGALTNTVNDAVDVAAVLKKIGFEVILKKNLTQAQMDDAIYLFENRLLETKGIGFFYFAGHGARVAGTNYLLPIDNDKIRNERDLKYYAIDAHKVLNVMQSTRKNVNIIVLDACRDNPYTVTGRNIKHGLGKIEPPRGSIIAFAADAGKTASDFSRNGRNGLFTSHLINALDMAYKTHQRVDDMFMAISNAVMRESGGQQEPWQLDSLKRPFCFGGCQVANVVPNPQPKPFPAGKVFQDRLKDGGLGPKIVIIPSGYFRMGDIQGDGESDETQHRVFIEKFAIGMYEVTFAEYDKFAEATGRRKPYDRSWGRGNHPVINISWNDATAYAKWLSQQTGYTYRLPTEAEWEYAARAGTETKFWWGNDIGRNQANCYGDICGDNFQYTSPVGSFDANQFGLYDTAGNVWEWTCSEFTYQYNNKEKQCVTTAIRFVLRGGSWLSEPKNMRSANRHWNTPSYRDAFNGFRLVRLINF